ncbi:MAG: manganese efflux pump [Clostridia bacterium]|nr:manganese efflux pump [Clostridia bacterium]
MDWNFVFFFNSILLGVGLAMDAFSVSLANGLNEPKMRLGKRVGIAGVFSVFQALMPLIGWICVHTIVQYFQAFEKFIPWIALILLCYIGGKMIFDCFKNDACDCDKKEMGIAGLLVQGVATSIDALSVGFTIADYGLAMAIVCALIIAVVTFIICVCGVELGRFCATEIGKRCQSLSGRFTIIGGIILIIIGLEIFITGVFFN